MRTSRRLSLIAALLLCLCSGCGTEVSILAGRHCSIRGPYSGVRTDCLLLHEGSAGDVLTACAALVDIPLCALLDTALLPYTVWIPWTSPSDR